MWLLVVCLYANGVLNTCAAADTTFETEDSCHEVFDHLVERLDAKKVVAAGQDVDIDCRMRPIVASVRPPVDRSRG